MINEIQGWEFISVLREPNKYESEYTNSLYLSELCYNIGKGIDDIIQYLSSLIFGASFWNALREQVELASENDLKHKHGQPYDFIDFAIKMKKDFIGILPNKTTEKEVCQKLSAFLQQYSWR